MILNILIMIWIAFNIVLLIDAIIFTYQTSTHKEKLHKLRRCGNFDYERWRAAAPKRAIEFKSPSIYLYALVSPAFLVVAISYFTFLFLAAVDAATRAFFETLFNTFKDGFK